MKIEINPTWTLFLDRDGVINKDIEGSYVLSVDQFEFLPNVLPAFAKFNDLFMQVIVVTNQRCIGRGLLKEEELEAIHEHMLRAIIKAGGKIDKIYYAPVDDIAHNLRKPNIGMALQAQLDYPNIDLTKSIMIGNSISDMQFGKKTGMTTIYITKKIYDPHEKVYIDYEVTNLEEAVELMTTINDKTLEN